MSVLPVTLVLDAYPFTFPAGATAGTWTRPPVGAMPRQLFSALDGLLVGSKTSVARTDTHAKSANGKLMPSFYDYFYNRIHVLPAVLDLGNVTANASVQTVLWNAYTEDRLVASDSLANDAGVEVVGEAAPFTLTPLSFRIYEITVLQDGPATVALNLGWVVSGEAVGFSISATRIIPFFYPPNWQREVSETLEWRTTIGSSFTGEEQRQQIRSKPRREWAYSVLLNGDKGRNAYFDILGFQNKTFGLPVWTDKSFLTARADAGDTVISVSTTNKGFVAGSIVFVNTGDLVETHEIASLTTGTITLQKPLGSAFAVGSAVYPGAVVQMPQNFTTRRLTDSVIEGQFTFAGVPQDTDPYLPAGAASLTLDGYEVINRKPNYASGVDLLFDYPVEEIDYLAGISLRAISRDYPNTGYRLRYLLDGRADIEVFRSMLGRLKGRHTPVFVNLFSDDFRLSGILASGGTGFQIHDNHSDMGIFPQRHPIAVLFETTDAGTIVRRMTDISLNLSGLIDVQIATSPGTLITEQTAKRITVCPLVRLASDQVAFKWLTTTVAECELTFQVVSR